MNISSRTNGGTQIITVRESRIDAAVAIRFKDRMRKETEHGTRRVVLDLAQVDFIDSSGLGAIVATLKMLGEERGMELSGLRVNVAKVFQLTRMNTVFTIHATLDTALECDA